MNDLSELPANIKIAHKGRKGAVSEGEEAKKWVVTVVTDLHRVKKTKTGKPIISIIGAYRNNHVTIEPAIGAFESTSSLSRSPRNPKQLDRKPPTVWYNPESGPGGLGKEMWHASEQMKGAMLPPLKPPNDHLKWDLDAVKIQHQIEAELREIDANAKEQGGRKP